MLRPWILAIRPKTLTAAIAPVMVGSALAWKASSTVFSWWIALITLVGAIFIQIGTNLFNDVLDYEKGTDTAERLGPKRVVQSGLLSPCAVRRAAYLSFVMALGFGIPLVAVGGWPIVAIGMLSLLCGYAYTGGPFSLSYTGTAEIFVILFFGVIAVSGTFFLQTKSISPDAILAGLQVGLLATLLLAINNARDRQGDAKSKKKTLAVRFGQRFATCEVIFLCLMPFMLTLFFLKNHTQAALFPWLASPLAGIIVYKTVILPPGRKYNDLLGKAAGLHLLFSLLLSIGFIWD
ncbi:MAG: 1,4-dihydroxy-2-naphthoate polyprenyltransferase [Deltaproteobacteria bacterium]|nr:1,4-dihydroxy-2-naphthoate polyprenyltransferase [Deltaproteobacteria bacterium]